MEVWIRAIRFYLFTDKQHKTTAWDKLQYDLAYTCFAAVELHPHTNMAIPASRDDANEPGYDWWVDNVWNFTVLVTVGLEILKNQENKRENE